MKNISWHSDKAWNDSIVPANLLDWLVDPGSFMGRLRRHGITSPSVTVLSQHWQFPTREETVALEIPSRTYALIREVLIGSENADWMFARTVFPSTMLKGKNQRFARLKNRPLGSMLFHNPLVTRSEFEFTCLQPDMSWHKKITQHVDTRSQELWARRSLFYIQNKSLLLAEIFLPAVKEIK